jgi:hypothetical protein
MIQPGDNPAQLALASAVPEFQNARRSLISRWQVSVVRKWLAGVRGVAGLNSVFNELVFSPRHDISGSISVIGHDRASARYSASGSQIDVLVHAADQLLHSCHVPSSLSRS